MIAKYNKIGMKSNRRANEWYHQDHGLDRAISG
jgi:hypothetical protein